MQEFDVIVIGGGHAGAEAAWAASRIGARTAMITLDPTKIGAMSCNPAIGGLAKGQMVREIDAIGGLMGLATDATGIQFRMLNRSKGPAVWGPRAQCDKYKYAAEVQRLLSTCDNLTIIRGEVADLNVDRRVSNVEANQSTIDNRHSTIAGVTLADGKCLRAKSVVVTTGTFLRALMHTGEKQTEGGRVGEAAAKGLSGCLQRLGLELGRLKTGTPPRLHRDSIDFSKFEPQSGDSPAAAFSYMREYFLPLSVLREGGRGESGVTSCATSILPSPRRSPGVPEEGGWTPPLPQIQCFLGKTNQRIHEIIRANLHRAPMYSGQISSTGPRYCPSIEDKVVRFAEKESHQIFLEPEGLDTPEIYVNGISTSLPADVQEQIVPLIPGLEKAKILRHGYAVEYDMVWPTQIRATLETKSIRGLYLAGQINGTSGYEEAAGQGLIAGINAARAALHAESERSEDSDLAFVLRRDQAYIGVLIDDLVTKPPTEPYRMFTSRAEHRLHLRNDNADERLTPLGREIGLVDDARWNAFRARQELIDRTVEKLKQTRIEGTPAYDWLRREGNDWQKLTEIVGTGIVACVSSTSSVVDPVRDETETQTKMSAPPRIDGQTAWLIEVRAKYEGYIKRQDQQIAKFAKMESKLIPASINYASVVGLRNEARQKLSKFTPRSLGQALRISGITPADVTLISIHLERGASK